MAEIKTYGDFVAKYGLDDSWQSFDEDKTLPGFQNKKFRLEEIISDFNSLSNEDRFVLFRQFRGRHERELLRAITGTTSHVDAENLMNAVGQFKSNVYGKLFGRKDRWEIRFEIAKGLFAIEDMLEMAQANFVKTQEPVEAFTQLREKIFREMVELYRCTGSDFPGCSSTGGNMYFDTDDDFTRYADSKERELFFDDKDSNPLDPWEHVDLTTQWRGLSPSESVSVRNLCDVKRDKDGRYQITVKIHLKPAEDLKDERMRAKLQEPQYLEWKARLINHFYETHRDADAANIVLDVRFVLDPKEAHHTVEVSGNNYYRSHSGQWQSDILYNSEAGVMLHEVMHSLGLPDYYHETAVDSGIRDRTFRPGFVLIDPENIMNGTPPEPKIRAIQMRHIIYSAWRRSITENYDNQRPQPVHKPSASEIAETAAHNAYAQKDFKKLEKAVKSILKHYPGSPWGLAYSFICRFEKNGIKGARPLLDKVLSLHWSYSIVIVEYLCKRGEIALAEKMFLKGTADENLSLLESFAQAAFETRNFPKAKEYFERSFLRLKWFRDDLVPIHYNDYIRTLEALNEYEKIAGFYRSQVAKDPYNMGPRKRLIGIYMKAKDYQNAAKELVLAVRAAEDIHKNHRLERGGYEWVHGLWQNEEQRKSLLENLKAALNSVKNLDLNTATAYAKAIELTEEKPKITLNR